MVGKVMLSCKCRTAIMFPQSGHSNLDAVTHGLISDFCLITPSKHRNFPRCSVLMFLIDSSWFLGRL